MTDEKPFALTSEAAKKLSKLGASKGGEARANNLSAERRSEIARAAVEARWAKAGKEPPLKALHSGNFLDDFGVDVDCYVLNDSAKTAVISQRGMAQALGLSKRGDRLPVFVASKTMEGYIGRDLREKLTNPIIFQRKASAAGNALSRIAHGYDATVLADLWNAIIAARKDGKLAGSRYDKMVNHAQIVLGASVKAGIKGLVYALSGYNPSTEEVIEAFKVYVQEEARKYESEFPPELYKQWHNLYEIPVLSRGKPWQFKHLTVRHVYYPLAQSNGKIFDLLKALKAKDGDRQKKLFQFLNEIGARALRIQLGRILEMAESSANRREYEKKVVQRFGGQQEIEFIVPSAEQMGSRP
jgi:hypothetical protein